MSIIITIIVSLLIIASLFWIFRKKLLLKNLNIEDAQKEVVHWVSEFQELEKVSSKKLIESRKKFYIYSQQEAVQLKRHNLPNHGFYYRKYVSDGKKQFEYTRFFYQDTCDVPNYADSRLVYSGIGDEQLIPNDKNDFPILSKQKDQQHLRARMEYFERLKKEQSNHELTQINTKKDKSESLNVEE